MNRTHVKYDALMVDALDLSDDVVPVSALGKNLGNLVNIQART